MQAARGVEPLSGEAQVNGGACADMHPTKGQVRRLPHFRPSVIRGKNRPPDVTRADEEHFIRLPSGTNALTASPIVFQGLTERFLDRLHVLHQNS